MTRRKVSSQSEPEKRVLHFTPDDIIRAIEAVQQAGLTVYGVEITLNGSINIATQPPLPSRAAGSKPITGGAVLDEVQPKKGRA